MPLESFKEVAEKRKPTTAVPAVSAVFSDGSILETVYDLDAHQTHFVLWRDGTWDYEDSHRLNAVERWVPYSANHNLIRGEMVLLPSAPCEYGSEAELVAEVKSFIHRYVDVSPLYEDIASYYVLFSWVHDAFNELPYLRVRGDAGTGKTRFLLMVGSLCYKPVFASGASTVSPIFRMLEMFRGTLVIDESDLRFSDEKAEMVKIFNNGNVKGFPVLRSETNREGEFNPRAYHVFGPKIVATRGDFEDRALESRFLTEDMGGTAMRSDVPINLPAEHKAEALALRNKLLLYRFRNLHDRPALANLVDRTLEPRLNQIFVPLLSVIGDPAAQETLRALMRQRQRDIVAERSQETEGLVLEVIQELLAASRDGRVPIKEITARFAELYAAEYERNITNKWIGTTIRTKLRLKSVRSHGTFAIPPSEGAKLERLFEKYGLREPGTPQPEVPMSPRGDSAAA
jgi:hypothetical protein